MDCIGHKGLNATKQQARGIKNIFDPGCHILGGHLKTVDSNVNFAKPSATPLWSLGALGGCPSGRPPEGRLRQVQGRRASAPG